jgi:hypothetical protein
MKVSILFLALTQLAFGLNNTTAADTPAGCKKLATDAGWPTPAEWKAAMPEVEKHKQGAGARHPDYLLRAESYKDVQSAVRFCANNNIRLVIITSGHVSSLGRCFETDYSRSFAMEKARQVKLENHIDMKRPGFNRY